MAKTTETKDEITPAPAPAEPASPAKPKDGMVEVSAEKLEKLFERLSRLESVASKSALAHVDEKNREKPGKTVKLRLLDGKVVVGEKTVSNVCEKNPQGVYREDIQVEVTLKDGETKTMPFVFYVRAYRHEVAKVLAETKNMEQDDIDAMGPCVFKVRRDSGEIMEVGEKFLN